tara:strand:+ start:277 stop:780 length:504 start_codon:yes stop_codon:yes gene_type:complete
MNFWILILGILSLVIFLFWISVVFLGAPFDSTNRKTLRKMIKFSKIKKGEKVADLGSGNGKIVIEFAKRGIEAHGFEVNPFLVWFSRRKIKKLNLEKKAFIHQKNFWKQDFSQFDLISIFQVGYIMGKLEKKLKKELKKGSRVISNTWKFPNWKPEKQEGYAYLYKV